MQITKKIPLFSVLSMANKEVSSWKSGVRIKNPFESAFICVLNQDLGFGDRDFANNKNLCVLCGSFSLGEVWRGLCVLCV
jgi:hypothetical protein